MKGNQIQNLGPVWYMCLNTRFQFLNNVIHIFEILFHLHVFPKNTNNVIKWLPISQKRKSKILLLSMNIDLPINAKYLNFKHPIISGEN